MVACTLVVVQQPMYLSLIISEDSDKLCSPESKVPDLLEIPPKDWSRWSLYAGFLDIANGNQPWKVIEEELKFAALFYPHVVVPDGFVHCNGPLLTHLQRVAQYSQLQRGDDGLLALLDAGILVPAIRRGDSVLANWEADREGVHAGKLMIARKGTDVKGALSLFDQTASSFVSWPKALEPDGERGSRFASAVRDAFVSANSPFNLDPAALPVQVMDQIAYGPHVIPGMLDAFRRLLDSAVTNSAFRRGDVEGLIGTWLGLDMKCYAEIHSLVDFQNPTRTLAPSIGLELLNATSTAYELMQAAEFGCIAGLFGAHDLDIVRADVGHAIVPLNDLPELTHERAVYPRSLNLTNVSVFDILRFRQQGKDKRGHLLFDRYKQHLREIRQVPAGYSFVEANAAYVEFLTKLYVPEFLREFPQATATPGAVAGVGRALATIGGVARGFEEVSAGPNVWTVLACVGGLLAAVEPAVAGRRWWGMNWRLREFNRINYAFWNRRMPYASS